MTQREQRRASSNPQFRADSIRSVGTRSWVDVSVLFVLTVLGLVGFEPPFGGFSFLLAGLGGLAVGAATGIVAGMLRLSVVSTVLAAVLGYFLLGSAFAVPNQAILGVLPSLQSLASLAVGAVYGWADIVTLQTPIGAPEYISVVPFVATWVVALVATSLATRWLPYRPRAAWRNGVILLGPVSLYLAGILIGTDNPYQAGVRGTAFAVITLVWVAWRTPVGGAIAADGTRRLRNRKLAGTAVLVAGAVLLGGGSAFVLAPPEDQRFVLRDEIDPPFDPLQFPSPLAGFREYSKLMRDDTLFTVDGLQTGDRVRLATMDTFSGKLWNVTGPETQTGGSGSFSLVGRELPHQNFITADRRELRVTIADYSDVWIPSIGYPTSLEFTGGAAGDESDEMRYNVATGTAVLTSGLSDGDSYRIRADVQRVLTPEALRGAAPAAITLPPITDNPDVTTSKAQEFAGGATEPAAQLEAIRLNLSEDGYLSHGLASDSVPSRAGHGADRIDDLLSRNQMIGDEEQFASAFALMASTFGYPARVVMGFAPEVIDGQTTEVRGEHVTAWVEVAFDGIGWVAYDPTPEETDIPQDQTPKPQIEPQPQVRQPPRADNDPEDLLTPVELDNEDTDDETPFVIPGWVYAIALSILVPATIVLMPMLVIATLKARRVRRRRSAPTADQQVAGAWDELVDRYSELGYTVPKKSTRRVVAGALESQVAESERPPQLLALATDADEAVFSGNAVDTKRSERVWTEAIAAVAVAEQAVTRTRRLMSRYRVRPHRAARRSTKRTRP